MQVWSVRYTYSIYAHTVHTCKLLTSDFSFWILQIWMQHSFTGLYAPYAWAHKNNKVAFRAVIKNELKKKSVLMKERFYLWLRAWALKKHTYYIFVHTCGQGGLLLINGVALLYLPSVFLYYPIFNFLFHLLGGIAVNRLHHVMPCI